MLRRNAESGVSLIEVTVALFLVTVIGLLYYSLFIGTMNINRFLESHNDLSTIGQRSVNVIRDEVIQSSLLLDHNALGLGYLARLTVPPARPVLGGSLLPVIDPTGSIVPDSGTRRVGNSLLIVREELPLSFWIDDDNDAQTPDVELLADGYRFEYIYLSQNTDRSFENRGYYLDLIRAQSAVYADYFQLSGLAATARQQLAAALNGQGITVAWDPGQSADQAFYTIAGNGTLNGPVAHTIALPEFESFMPEFRGGRTQGKMEYSVGIQSDPPLDTADPVNLFTAPSGAFPGGFETLITGPSSSRKVFVRLVLVSQHGSKLNSSVNSVTATTSEF